MNTKKGFTIIELIVVIAIIAVLAAVVMVNVTQYINKGKDASAKGNLSNLLTNAAVVMEANGNFTNFCSDTAAPGLTYYKPIKDALFTAGYTATCTVGGTGDSKWCASVQLKFESTKSFCVDSTGKKVEAAGATCASGACP